VTNAMNAMNVPLVLYFAITKPVNSHLLKEKNHENIYLGPHESYSQSIFRALLE